MSIPILNARREIVGWTEVAPVVVRNRLRHRQAERLLGGPIFCVEIALTAPRDLALAGAPRGWRDTWRCMALCSDERIGSVEQIGRFLAEPGDAPSPATPAGADCGVRGRGTPAPALPSRPALSPLRCAPDSGR